ncbi:TPA: hypothetical protein N0F65_010259 [Lagenidium giganteum]|uniref:Uncharacterized protein n=1 Tax=Lagenidium giganteum TaxID=4803 RepID=A0AAV2YIG0_9STRA|nr:TPA: hypothetical protein N0F65_010259 [Lagenidium giganteum]
MSETSFALLPNSTLPEGLRDADFPDSLVDIGITFSDLQTLPPGLGSIWPSPLATLLLEHNAFTEVPKELLAIDAHETLSLAGNPISVVPDVLFTKSTGILNLRALPLASLPEVSVSTGIVHLQLDYTRISNLPNWTSEVNVSAFDTPLCESSGMANSSTIPNFQCIIAPPVHVFPVADRQYLNQYCTTADNYKA